MAWGLVDASAQLFVADSWFYLGDCGRLAEEPQRCTWHPGTSVLHAGNGYGLQHRMELAEPVLGLRLTPATYRPSSHSPL